MITIPLCLTPAAAMLSSYRYRQLAVAIAAILALPCVSVVEAYASGSGNCPAGGVAIAAAGNEHSKRKNENGPLSKRGTAFAMNGADVNGGESYALGTTLRWTLNTTDTKYGMRGVLIRVAHTGGDSFTIDSEQLNDLPLCTGTGVSGLTHKDASVKKTVSGNMRFDTAGNVTVDITVVYRNGGRLFKRVSASGYSQYKFSIKGKPPTRAPVRTVPVRAPVRAPT
jgi:hypothetical protein